MKRFYLLAAIFAAAAVHRCVDLLVSARLASGTDLDYRHVAIAPVALAASAMLAGLVGFAFADRNGWFENVVGSLEAVSFGRTFLAIFVPAVAVLFTIESLEQLVSLGHLDGVTSWLGTSVPLALVLFACVCAAMSFGLHRAARSVLRAMAVVRAFVERAIALRARRRSLCGNSRVSAFVAASYALVTIGVRGLRAPPQLA